MFLGDVVTNDLVCVFDEAFLPGRVWVCAIDLGMEHLGDIFVVGELGSVVGGDGEDMVFERAQHLYDKPCHSLGILAFLEDLAISTFLVARSTMVTMAPLPSFPTMVSISQSPKRAMSSTTAVDYSTS